MSSYSVPLTWIVQGRAVLELLWASACACSLSWRRPPIAVTKSMVQMCESPHCTLARFSVPIGRARPITSGLPVTRPESVWNAHNTAARLQALRGGWAGANLRSRDRLAVHRKLLRAGWAQLSKVGLHHIDHLIGRVRLLRIRSPLWVKHVMPDVAFQEFSH
jgi:hypothetical protein